MHLIEFLRLDLGVQQVVYGRDVEKTTAVVANVSFLSRASCAARFVSTSQLQHVQSRTEGGENGT